MKISPRTMVVLKNFASINPSLQFKKGSVITTISPQKSVMAKARVAETFDQQFAIFDLARFLAVVSLFSEPEITTEQHYAVIEGDGQRVRYTYADPEMIVTPPDKEMKLGDPIASFDLTSDSLNRMLKAMAVLQTPELAVVGDDGKIVLETFDAKNSTSDTFSVVVGETENKFRMIFKVENLKLVNGDYHVEISPKCVGYFKGSDIEYWVSGESSSTIG